LDRSKEQKLFVEKLIWHCVICYNSAKEDEEFDILRMKQSLSFDQRKVPKVF
jgi:hypothetical protein